MNLCSDLEGQRIFKLNECFLVANRIREAGRNERQVFGKLECGKPKPNGGGGGASTSPNSSNWVIISAKDRFALTTQGFDPTPNETSFPLPRSSYFGKKSLAVQALTISATPKE